MRSLSAKARIACGCNLTLSLKLVMFSSRLHVLVPGFFFTIKKLYSRIIQQIAVTFFLLLAPLDVFAQTPGQIFESAAGDGRLVLDPNGDGFVSKENTGFDPTNIDYGDAIEIGYHPLPVLFQEESGDQSTGGDHTDLIGVINGVDGYEDPGAFLYSDGVNFLFRMRLAGQSSASKGYTFLFDTSLNGRPDWEVIMKTGGGQAGISIYDSEGNLYADGPSALPLALNSHLHKALAGIHNDAQTYFYDWYIPWLRCRLIPKPHSESRHPQSPLPVDPT